MLRERIKSSVKLLVQAAPPTGGSPTDFDRVVKKEMRDLEPLLKCYNRSSSSLSPSSQLPLGVKSVVAGGQWLTSKTAINFTD